MSLKTFIAMALAKDQPEYLIAQKAHHDDAKLQPTDMEKLADYLKDYELMQEIENKKTVEQNGN